MDLQLYNTRTRRKERFDPQTSGEAGIYVCGPTVYDYSHLGHARCYIVYDVLVRHLRSSGQVVKYVRNITDVDDKIINRSKELGEPALMLTERFTQAFHDDLARLGCLNADIEPKVSEHIPDIIALIQTLIAKGAAYESQGDVYFDVPAFQNYGALSGRRLSELALGASGRIDDAESKRKRYPADFALWKHDAEAELAWDSPWGKGRPGWHIECSTMSMRYLGTTLDLHGGGLDLVFPHHENELAQSEAATGKPFARMWMHNGFVEISKEKMSKSLGNCFTIREVFNYVEPEAIRYFMLSVHYRSPLNLDWQSDDAGNILGFPLIEEAERRVEYLYHTKKRISSIPKERQKVSASPSSLKIDALEPALKACLDDDLNTPNALAAIADFLKQANEIADTLKSPAATIDRAVLATIVAGFDCISQSLGLGLDTPEAFLTRVQQRRLQARGISADEVQLLVKERAQARRDKDYARADSIRVRLEQMNIELLDASDATSWRVL